MSNTAWARGEMQIKFISGLTENALEEQFKQHQEAGAYMLDFAEGQEASKPKPSESATPELGNSVNTSEIRLLWIGLWQMRLTTKCLASTYVTYNKVPSTDLRGTDLRFDLLYFEETI